MITTSQWKKGGFEVHSAGAYLLHVYRKLFIVSKQINRIEPEDGSPKVTHPGKVPISAGEPP